MDMSRMDVPWCATPKHQAAGRRCRSLRLCRHLGFRKVWISIGNSPSNGEVMHQPFKSPGDQNLQRASSDVFYEVPSTQFTKKMLTISLSPMNSLSLWNSDVLKPRIFMNLIIIWALIATTMYHVHSNYGHIKSYRSFPSTVIIQVFRNPHDLPQPFPGSTALFRYAHRVRFVFGVARRNDAGLEILQNLGHADIRWCHAMEMYNNM